MKDGNIRDTNHCNPARLSCFAAHSFLDPIYLFYCNSVDREAHFRLTYLYQNCILMCWLCEHTRRDDGIVDL